MCTVTIVPDADGFRLMCNRDEQRQRAPALLPVRHPLGTGVAIYPVDPVGGGTWIGVNDTGLAATLLNRTVASDRVPTTPSPPSRGLIVPALLHCRSLRDAIDLAASIDVASFSPFRLIVLQPMAGAVFTSDGAALTLTSFDPSRPRMLTSSSLGDRLVETPRTELFERLVVRHVGGPLEGQSCFHAHRWPSSGAISVTMERLDARTVSRTSVRVTSRDVALRYDPMDSSAPQTIYAR